jgi:hypothetical protein
LVSDAHDVIANCIPDERSEKLRSQDRVTRISPTHIELSGQ